MFHFEVKVRRDYQWVTSKEPRLKKFKYLWTKQRNRHSLARSWNYQQWGQITLLILRSPTLAHHRRFEQPEHRNKQTRYHCRTFFRESCLNSPSRSATLGGPTPDGTGMLMTTSISSSSSSCNSYSMLTSHPPSPFSFGQQLTARNAVDFNRDAFQGEPHSDIILIAF